MRAVTYCRVSTEDQAENYSIPTQLEGIHKYAIEHDMEIVKDCIDAGVSGALLPRPALNELRQLVASRQIDAVIIYDPDRLSRNLGHLLFLSNEFEKAGVELRFVTQPAGKTPEDRMLFNVRGVFAEYERTKISERTMRGKMQKAREGMQPGGRPPYGYKLIECKHVVNEEEAEVVRMVFEWLAKDRMTVRGIQKRLNEMKIPTRKGTTFWQHSTLHRIVREETYTGNWYYNKTVELPSKKKANSTLQHMKPREEWIHVRIPPIISNETFELAQRQLKKNAEFSKRNVKRQYLLSGLLVCGKCGYKYSARTLRNTVYYNCNSKLGHTESQSCDAHNVRGDVIEPLIWDSVKELLGNPELIVKQVKKQKESNGISYLEENLQAVNQKLTKKTLEADRLLEAYKIGAIDAQMLKKEMDKIRAEQEVLINTKKGIGKEIQEAGEQHINADYVEQFCNSISTMLDNLSFEEKRTVLREVVEKVIIKDSEISIYGIIPSQGELDDIEDVSIAYRSS